jgi:hypothetical protein
MAIYQDLVSDHGFTAKYASVRRFVARLRGQQTPDAHAVIHTRDPDRKGKVESGVGHAQRTPLRGMRFESIEEAQAYLDRWEANWADTRIHGTTKRQVAVMFAEEQSSLLPLPIEPFRYSQFGQRTMHLDGHVEVNGAYYCAPPGYIGHTLPVRWDDQHARTERRRPGSSCASTESRTADVSHAD